MTLVCAWDRWTALLLRQETGRCSGLNAARGSCLSCRRHRTAVRDVDESMAGHAQVLCRAVAGGSKGTRECGVTKQSTRVPARIAAAIQAAQGPAVYRAADLCHL